MQVLETIQVKGECYDCGGQTIIDITVHDITTQLRQHGYKVLRWKKTDVKERI